MNSVRDPGGFSFELSESAPPVRSEELSPMGDLDLDLDDFGQSLSPAPDPAAPVWTSSPFSPLLPETTGSVSPETLVVPSVNAPAPVDKSEQAAPMPAAASEQPAPSLAPTVKKISFPKSKPQTVAPTLTATKSSPATRFSASISQRAPEAALLDRDSDPDQAESLDQQTIPEDLPEPDEFDKAVSVGLETRPAGWGNDTPTAQEIWRKARRAWQTTSKHAVTFSGQGLKSAQKLAQNVNHKLQTRLEEGARQRKRQLDAEQCATLIQPRPAEPTVSSRAPAQRAHSDFDLRQDSATSPDQSRSQRSPSQTKTPLAAWARGSLKTAAAPLAALSAAFVVYLAGTYVLGGDGAISLQKTAAAGTQIPNLGRLPSSADHSEKKASANEPNTTSRSSGKQDDSSIPEMKSEQTKMPEGLSWPGKGLIEVVTSEDELIYIDGVFTGRGPLRRIPVTPGKHHVAIKTGGQKRTGEVSVDADKNTRAIFTAPATPQ